jgi:hypothetical protein
MFTSMRSSHFTVNGIAKTLMIAPPKWMNGNRMNVMTLYRGASRMIVALMSLLIGHHIMGPLTRTAAMKMVVTVDTSMVVDELVRRLVLGKTFNRRAS